MVGSQKRESWHWRAPRFESGLPQNKTHTHTHAPTHTMSNHVSLSAFVDSLAKIGVFFFFFFFNLFIFFFYFIGLAYQGKDIIVFRFIIEYIVA
jgi:hypothetical protein